MRELCVYRLELSILAKNQLGKKHCMMFKFQSYSHDGRVAVRHVTPSNMRTSMERTERTFVHLKLFSSLLT